MLALALVLVVLAIVVARFLRAQGALRRALGPVLGTGALVMGVLLVSLVVEAFSEDGAAEPLYYVFLVTFALVPVAFLAGVLRSRLARSGVGDLLLELGARHADPGRARARARATRRSRSPTGCPRRAATSRPTASRCRRTATRASLLVEHGQPPDGGAPPRPLLADEPELVEAVSAAAALWLDNERLQAKLRAQYEFLETIVNAAPSLLCSLDREGRIANLNEASRRGSGYADEEDVRWQPFWDVFVAPEERDEARYRFEAAPRPTRPRRSSTRSSTGWARR